MALRVDVARSGRAHVISSIACWLYIVIAMWPFVGVDDGPQDLGAGCRPTILDSLATNSGIDTVIALVGLR